MSWSLNAMGLKADVIATLENSFQSGPTWAAGRPPAPANGSNGWISPDQRRQAFPILSTVLSGLRALPTTHAKVSARGNVDELSYEFLVEVVGLSVHDYEALVQLSPGVLNG